MSRSRSSLWKAAAVLVGALAAACGGAGDLAGDGVASAGGAPARSASAEKKADPQQAGLEFARCMREHGVDMPDPEPGQGGFAVRIGGGPGDSAPSAAGGPVAAVSLDDDEAFAACRHILDGAVAGSDLPPDPELADRALKFAQCMREHGVNMPDPQVNGGSVSIMIGEGLDPGSPALQAAHEACGDLFGPGGGGGGGPAAPGGAGFRFGPAAARS